MHSHIDMHRIRRRFSHRQGWRSAYRPRQRKPAAYISWAVRPTWITAYLLTPEGWKTELARLADP